MPTDLVQIEILKNITVLAPSGDTMSWVVGEREEAYIDNVGCAHINWGCGQKAMLYYPQFKICADFNMSDKEKMLLYYPFWED